MIDTTLIFVTLITTIGGIIGMLLWQRGSVINWSMKMDYMDQNLKHKINIEQIRARKNIDLQKLKQEAKAGTMDLGALANLDLDGVRDIIDSLSGEGSILSNPIVRGLVQGYLGKGGQTEQLPEQFQNVVFED